MAVAVRVVVGACWSRKTNDFGCTCAWLKRRPDMDGVGPPEWKGKGGEGGSTELRRAGPVDQ